MQFASIDFGASSGRVVCGRFDGRVMTLEPCHRFANRPVRLPDGLRWNLLHLFTEAVGALRGRKLDGVGVDTWGVDYALLDEHGRVLGLPFHYRDGRTEGIAHVDGYAVTGIQDMPINTVYQLLAERDSAALREAHAIALVPDLLAYWLSGELANEITNASTTALLDARTGEWAHELIAGLGLPKRPFGALVEPGTLLGPALAHHEFDAPVYTVASHDTASAYAATPLRDEHSAILSSGTWSLLGLELPRPVFSDSALTNERGVDGTIRLLKNVMGLWLEQECARVWDAGFAELHAAARAVTGTVPIFDPDDERFLRGGDMPQLIAHACGRPDMSRGEIVRSIYVSLAHKYRLVLERLEAASGRDVRTLHVIGGGAQNELLCQLTADVTGREVLAGPVEATALGNVLVQARAAGELDSLADMRAVSAASFKPVHYEPSDMAPGGCRARTALRGDFDVTDLTAAFRELVIETPSWGYGDSGTRFGVFLQAGRPRGAFERLDDAAQVHRLTGTAGAVALHFPWDAVEDYDELRAAIESRGLRVGAVNPNLFQDPDYKLGSVTHPDPAVREKAVVHMLECAEIATALGASAQSLWLADGTSYPGQDDLRERRRRMLDSLGRVYDALPVEQELLVEYKFFEPAFYATDLADWGSALLTCLKLGGRAKVLVDLGHHAQGTNIEQIVAFLEEEGRLGGFHFNNRKYADDDLIVGSVNPFELFLIFVELAAVDRLPRLTIDQSHNVEAKVEAMTLSVVNLQEAYAKALLVDRAALRAAQQAGDVLGGHEVLLDAFNTDVRPACAEARVALGAAENPIRALRESGYAERMATERENQTELTR